MANDLRRGNGGFGKFWREYNGFVPLVTATASAVGIPILAGIAEVLHSGGSPSLYSGDLANVAKGLFDTYKMGAHTAGEYIAPAFLAGQFVGYKFKMSIKPLLGLK